MPTDARSGKYCVVWRDIWPAFAALKAKQGHSAELYRVFSHIGDLEFATQLEQLRSARLRLRHIEVVGPVIHRMMLEKFARELKSVFDSWSSATKRHSVPVTHLRRHLAARDIESWQMMRVAYFLAKGEQSWFFLAWRTHVRVEKTQKQLRRRIGAILFDRLDESCLSICFYEWRATISALQAEPRGRSARFMRASVHRHAEKMLTERTLQTLDLTAKLQKSNRENEILRAQVTYTEVSIAAWRTQFQSDDAHGNEDPAMSPLVKEIDELHREARGIKRYEKNLMREQDEAKSLVDELKDQLRDTGDPDKKVHIQVRLQKAIQMYSNLRREFNYFVARGEGVARKIKALDIQIAEQGNVVGDGVLMMKRHVEESFANLQAEMEYERSVHQAELWNVQHALDAEKEENAKLTTQLKETKVMVHKLRPVAMQHAEFDRLLSGLLQAESDALSSGGTEPLMASTEVLPRTGSSAAESTVSETPMTLERENLRRTHRMLEEELSQVDILRKQLREAHVRIKAWIVQHGCAPSASTLSLPNWAREVERLLEESDQMVNAPEISSNNLHEVQTFLHAIKVQKTRLFASVEEAKACLPCLSLAPRELEPPASHGMRAPPKHAGQPMFQDNSPEVPAERTETRYSSLSHHDRLPTVSTDSSIAYPSSPRSPSPLLAPHSLSPPAIFRKASLSPKPAILRQASFSPRSVIQRQAVISPSPRLVPQPRHHGESIVPGPTSVDRQSVPPSVPTTRDAVGVPSVPAPAPPTLKDAHAAMTCDMHTLTQQGSRSNGTTAEVMLNGSAAAVLKEPGRVGPTSPRWITRLKSTPAITPPSHVYSKPTMQIGRGMMPSRMSFPLMGSPRGMVKPSGIPAPPTFTHAKVPSAEHTPSLRRAVLSAPALHSPVFTGERKLAFVALRPPQLECQSLPFGRPLMLESQMALPTGRRPMIAR
eukprot:GEMP01011356.1.p1 GENE.GEMP01011356.1~~GEMP01011356.1.p1  ORF type:complete len:941 (+),score=187.51 GEMP01011356.1:51-2873(+)